MMAVGMACRDAGRHCLRRPTATCHSPCHGYNVVSGCLPDIDWCRFTHGMITVRCCWQLKQNEEVTDKPGKLASDGPYSPKHCFWIQSHCSLCVQAGGQEGRRHGRQGDGEPPARTQHREAGRRQRHARRQCGTQGEGVRLSRVWGLVPKAEGRHERAALQMSGADSAAQTEPSVPVSRRSSSSTVPSWQCCFVDPSRHLRMVQGVSRLLTQIGRFTAAGCPSHMQCLLSPAQCSCR